MLGSLRPGMVYLGGTDPGCFIPTFLNETSSGEQHIVLTQNAFADATYLNYVQFLYGDKFSTITPEDSQKTFNNYLADAQKRLQHDNDFPAEPKQILPGENIKNEDGRVQVTGQVAVMAINEGLLKLLMSKNPDLSFALEESFPLKSTYADAAPLGPITEIGIRNEENKLTHERASQSLDYWRNFSQQLISDPDEAADSNARKTYSKMITAQANLFLDRHYDAEAEQAFGMATGICPGNPEAVNAYVEILLKQKRFDDAMTTVQNAIKSAPENKQFIVLREKLSRQR